MKKKVIENTFSEKLTGLAKVEQPQESWLDRRLFLANALYEMTETNIDQIAEARNYLLTQYGMDFQAWADAIKLTPAYMTAERDGEEVEKIYGFLKKLLYAYEMQDNGEKVYFPTDGPEPDTLKRRCSAFLGAFVKMVDGFLPVLHWGVKENSEIGVEFKKV